MPSTPQPKNWPPQLQHLHQAQHSKTLSSSQLTFLNTAPSAREVQTGDVVVVMTPPTHARTPKSSQDCVSGRAAGAVRIRDIVDQSHPACGQRGLFATRALRPGSFILPYLGVVHSAAGVESGGITAAAAAITTTSNIASSSSASASASTSPSVPAPAPASASASASASTLPSSSSTSAHGSTQPPSRSDRPAGNPSRGRHGCFDHDHNRSDYVLSLDRDVEIAIDAEWCGNEARFINDYRGVREAPNAEFRVIWDGSERGMGVFVRADGKASRKGRRRLERGSGKSVGVGVGVGKGEEVLVSYGKGFWGARREMGEERDDDRGVEAGG